VRPGHEMSTHYFSRPGRTIWIQQKSTGATYVVLVFLHPVGSAGHIVNFGASEVRNIDTLFFMLSQTGTDSGRSASGRVTPKLYFYIHWDLWVT
jgi:hypothetical protein